jgi:ribosomal protein S18 acetylase RimI-like enzyme
VQANPVQLPPLCIEPYVAADLDALIAMWRESFEFGIGVVDPHSLDEQASYFNDKLLPHYTILVAKRQQQLLGFIAFDAESVVQLFVRVGHFGQGLGSALLARAQAQSCGSLWLYTFARNTRARAFYERRGFALIAHGFEPTWQLDDVKYRWVRQPA